MKRLFSIFKRKPKYRLKNVQPGDFIQVYWPSRISGDGIGGLTCIENHPKKKIILLEVHWINFEAMNCEEYQKYMFHYKSGELRCFEMLNKTRVLESDVLASRYVSFDDMTIDELNHDLEVAVEKEDWEYAKDIRNYLNPNFKVEK